MATGLTELRAYTTPSMLPLKFSKEYSQFSGNTPSFCNIIDRQSHLRRQAVGRGLSPRGSHSVSEAAIGP
jgi:hypothetical protein